jgi:hypothetical protein
MEMTIFNHILFDSLMPWLVKSSDVAKMNEKLKEAVKGNTDSMPGLVLQLGNLLSDKPTLLKWVGSQPKDESEPLKVLTFSTELPEFTNTATKFYALLIDQESIRNYNAYLSISEKYAKDEVLLYFHTVNALRKLKQYILTASTEIKKRELSISTQAESDLTMFVLYYFKYNLIALYFSIQLVNKEILETVFEITDFYLIELGETKAHVHPIHYVGPQATKPVSKETASKHLSFGFNGKPDKLKSIINALCAKVELLDENRSPAELLIKLLQSKEITPGKVEIYLDCDNKNFRYIIERLKPSFSNFSYINIEHSQSFYSKKGTLLKSNNLSKAVSFNAKAKEEIDKIFNQLQ